MSRLALAVTLCLLPISTFAASVADATAHSKEFERAMNARDGKAVLALYMSDARVVWPGEGEEAHGTAEIEKLVTKTLTELPKDAKFAMKSQTAIVLPGGDLATIGQWEESFTGNDGKPQAITFRTTEIIRKVHGKTLYVVDHASVGLPPPADSSAH